MRQSCCHAWLPSASILSLAKILTWAVCFSHAPQLSLSRLFFRVLGRCSGQAVLFLLAVLFTGKILFELWLSSRRQSHRRPYRRHLSHHHRNRHHHRGIPHPDRLRH